MKNDSIIIIDLSGDHTLIIDGIRVRGFAEEDFIKIKQHGACTAVREIIDGQLTKNKYVPKVNIVTVGLQPKSSAIETILYLQSRLARTLPAHFYLFDVKLFFGEDEMVALKQCYFGNESQVLSKGLSAQFTIKCLELSFDRILTRDFRHV